MILTLCATVNLLLAFSGAAWSSTDNWPQWRGENFDSRSDETGLPVEFGPSTNLQWRFELPGPGGASPVVWDDRVFVTSIGGNNEILLICVASEDGRELWRQELKGKNLPSRDGGNSASPSPSTDGEHVWATSTAGFLECFDIDGKPVWSVDLQERYGKFQIQFGMTSTPLLDGDRLYLQLIHGSMRDRGVTSRGTVAAIDAKTGEEVWKHERQTDATFENKHSYASPIVVRDGDIEFLVTHGGDFVIGHSLDDGSELWRCGGLNSLENYNPTLRFVASPVYSSGGPGGDGMLVVPSAKNGPVIALKAGELEGDVTGDELARFWKLEKGTPDVATPVLANGLVFLARENGAMTCVDAENGKQVWAERMFADRHRSTPVVAEGRVYACGRDGTVVVIEASREAHVLARNELGEETLASPAVANGKIYIRTFQALYCFGE